MSAHYTVQDESENNQVSCRIGICGCSSVVIAEISMACESESPHYLPTHTTSVTLNTVNVTMYRGMCQCVQYEWMKVKED